MPMLTIGQLSKASKVNATAIRYYERCGLLQADLRSETGYRQYSPDAVAKLRFIKNAQHLGFTLTEIQALLQLQSNRNKNKCSSIKKKASIRLESIEKKIKSLKKMQQALKLLHDRCQGQGSLLECPIIEALNHTDFEDPTDES